MPKETRSFYYIVKHAHPQLRPTVITINFLGGWSDFMGGDIYYEENVREAKAGGRVLWDADEAFVIGDCIEAGGTHEEGMALVLKAREEKGLEPPGTK